MNTYFFVHLNWIHLESMFNEDIFAAIQCREGGSDTVVWAYVLHLEWSNMSWKINEGLRRKLWSKRMSCCCCCCSGTFSACCACIRPLAAALLSAICPVYKQLSWYKPQVNLRSALFHNSSGQLPTLCFTSLQVGFTFFVLKGGFSLIHGMH